MKTNFPKLIGAKVDKVSPPRPGQRDSRVDGNPIKPDSDSKKFTLKDLPKSPATADFNYEDLYEAESVEKTRPGLGSDPPIMRYKGVSNPLMSLPPPIPKPLPRPDMKQHLPISTPTPSSIAPSSGGSGNLDIRFGEARMKVDKTIWEKIKPVLLWILVPLCASLYGYFEGKYLGYKEMIGDVAAIKAKLETIDKRISENHVKIEDKLSRFDEDMNGAYAEARESKKQLDNFKKREFEPLKEMIEDKIPIIQGIPEAGKKK